MKKSVPPKDTGKQVDILAKNAGALVKSKPPKWRDFNRFVADFDRLKEYYDELQANRVGRADYPMCSADFDDEEAERCQELVARCKAGNERFDRPSNYDDPDDDESSSPLSREYIAKRLTVMVASIPTVNPSSPEGFMRMLIEHVSAVEGLTEPALESACREIVETLKFLTVAEAMPVIHKHVDEWGDRWSALHHVESMRLQTIKALFEREQKQQKEAREKEIKNVTWNANNAAAMSQRLAKEIEDAKTALARLITRHAEAEERMREMLESAKPIHAEVQNEAKENIAKLIDQRAAAEKRESEANSKLQALLAQGGTEAGGETRRSINPDDPGRETGADA